MFLVKDRPIDKRRRRLHRLTVHVDDLGGEQHAPHGATGNDDLLHVPDSERDDVALPSNDDTARIDDLEGSITRPIARGPQDVEGLLVDLNVRVLYPHAVAIDMQDPLEPGALVERLVVGRQRPLENATGQNASDEDPDADRDSVTMAVHASQ